MVLIGVGLQDLDAAVGQDVWPQPGRRWCSSKVHDDLAAGAQGGVEQGARRFVEDLVAVEVDGGCAGEGLRIDVVEFGGDAFEPGESGPVPSSVVHELRPGSSAATNDYDQPGMNCEALFSRP